jgi:hypothetical protein
MLAQQHRHGFFGFLIHDPQVMIFLRTNGNEAFTLE